MYKSTQITDTSRTSGWRTGETWTVDLNHIWLQAAEKRPQKQVRERRRSCDPKGECMTGKHQPCCVWPTWVWSFLTEKLIWNESSGAETGAATQSGRILEILSEPLKNPLSCLYAHLNVDESTFNHFSHVILSVIPVWMFPATEVDRKIKKLWNYSYWGIAKQKSSPDNVQSLWFYCGKKRRTKAAGTAAGCSVPLSVWDQSTQCLCTAESGRTWSVR